MTQIEPFPGEVSGRGTGGGGLRLNREQEQWFTKYYPCTPNRKIAAIMNIGANGVVLLRTRLGLQKDTDYIHAYSSRGGTRLETHAKNLTMKPVKNTARKDQPHKEEPMLMSTDAYCSACHVKPI